ncbi:hypothetical protein CCP4SC76_4250012 [Gammaproteobacteria bacterium]
MKREIITPLDAPEQFKVEAGIEKRERKAAEESPLVRRWVWRIFGWG